MRDNRKKIPPHLWSNDTWTGKMRRAINKLRNKEPLLTSIRVLKHGGPQDATHTLRWRCQLVLEYLMHRAEGVGQRDWGAYGHEAREED